MSTDQSIPLKIWLDDIRPAPEGWTWVKTYQEASLCLAVWKWSVISLDHDLGDYVDNGRECTGYDVLMRIVEMKLAGHEVGRVLVHSTNPVAQERMLGVIARYLDDGSLV